MYQITFGYYRLPWFQPGPFYDGVCGSVYDSVTAIIPFRVVRFGEPHLELLAIGIKHKLSGEQAHLIGIVAYVFNGVDFNDAVVWGQVR